MRKRFQIRPIWNALTGQAARAFIKRSIKGLIVRVYALCILILVLSAGYLAVHYLVRTVFYPPTVPAQILQWQGSLNVADLRATATAGVELPAPRAPISHYHRVDQWFQPDPKNGCTIDGCHEPLPHDQRAKVPAFANFHATFLACTMCHNPQQPGTVARWISTDTGEPQDAPAILQLLRYLEQSADTIQSQPATAAGVINPLLQQTISTLGGDAVLDELLAQMQSTQPGSPVWKRAVTELTSELPLHARGEYRAKLNWLTDDRAAAFATLSAQAQQYLPAPNPALLTTIHATLAKSPAPCLACHDTKPGMLDFAAAGYSPQRAKYLGSLQVARMMQTIREGQTFYLPNMEEGGQ
jgi:hypothetical protein